MSSGRFYGIGVMVDLGVSASESFVRRGLER